jgi:hypothetical protein
LIDLGRARARKTSTAVTSRRFSHSKVLIQKPRRQAVRVPTRLANFSVRGLYVQANNVMVTDDPTMPSW